MLNWNTQTYITLIFASDSFAECSHIHACGEHDLFIFFFFFFWRLEMIETLAYKGSENSEPWVSVKTDLIFEICVFRLTSVAYGIAASLISGTTFSI